MQKFTTKFAAFFRGGKNAAKTGSAAKKRFTVSVHPLFLLFGLWFLYKRQLFLFLVYTLVAVIHEFGHAAYAARIGCRLSRLRLLPCGAVVSGDIEGIPLSDEIRLALAGPLINAACAAGFVALWWLFPDTYPYTDTAAIASAFLAAVNLLPAYPLDGGRILCCLLVKWKGDTFARRCMLGVGIGMSCALGMLFAASCFQSPNVSILFFALFVLFGTFGARDERYTRFFQDFSRGLARGMQVKRVALLQSSSVRRAISFLERGKYLELLLFDESGGLVCVLSQDEFLEIVSQADIRAPVSVYLGGSEALGEDNFLQEEEFLCKNHSENSE